MCKLVVAVVRLGLCDVWREREGATGVRERLDRSCYMV